MALAYNSRIVRDGLVLHLDAANVKSYPGSGSTWFDLSGNGNNFTLAGVDYISAEPKHFSLVDNQGDYAYRSTTDVVGGLDDFTFDIVMRIDSFPQTLVTFISYATTTNNNAILFGRNGANQFTVWLGASSATVAGPLDTDYN